MLLKKETGFQTEKELVRAIVRLKAHPWGKIEKKSLGVLCEFESSAGRADVIFFRLKKNWKENMNYSQIPPRWLYALRCLPFRKRFTVGDFAFSSCVSKRNAMQVLAGYKRFGYCKPSNQKGYWLKIKQPVAIADKMIAIEAKLKNWKRAMSQACRYRSFADQAWVILDSSNANGAIEAINEFERLNVGLKIMDRKGNIQTYITPRLLSPKSPVHYWEANGLIAAAIDKRKISKTYSELR